MAWSFKTLKRYFEAKLAAMQLAVTKAEEATKIHFANVNEWRNQLDRQEQELARKTEVTNLQKQIDDNKVEIEKLKNLKQGGYNAWIILIAGITVLIALIILIITLV